MSWCIVGIFKNEAHGVREWVNHHLREGVGHIFLIDNGSTDDTRILLQMYRKDVLTVVEDCEKYAQETLYNRHCLKLATEGYDWVLALDLDEFVYARRESTIGEILSTTDPDVSEVQVRWKMFGSNGHIEQPSSIVNGFTQRCDFQKQKWIMDNVKSFARTSCLVKLGIHEHSLSCGKRKVIPRIRTESSLEKATMHLNHYRVQSKHWFYDVKLQRGDVASKRDETTRNQASYFEDNDYNGVEDEELKDISRPSLECLEKKG